MIVASSFEVGKADVLEKLAGDLTVVIRQSVRDGSSLDQLERGVWDSILRWVVRPSNCFWTDRAMAICRIVAFPLEYGASKVHRVQESLENTGFFVNLMF